MEGGGSNSLWGGGGELERGELPSMVGPARGEGDLGDPIITVKRISRFDNSGKSFFITYNIYIYIKG